MAFATALGVAQLIAYVGGIILKIKSEADKAKRKKRDCAYLVRYLSVIEKMLPTLPPDPEVELPLSQLLSTLKEADKLVVDCKDWVSFARRNADAFREVNDRITSDLGLFPLAFYTAIARHRAEDSILRDKQDGGTVTPGSSSSGSGHTSPVSDHHPRPRELTWAEIAAATNNLAIELGGGRSGTVYKGRLHHYGRAREVAVKVLKHGRQGKDVSYMAELEILYPIRHDHIAPLVGWCAEEERRMFVYDHMSNGTLRDHLLGLGGRGGDGSPVASSWSARFEVLLGAARALQHLHSSTSTAAPVIHRNVSSSNILLDASWTPRLSDFGQALWQEAGEHGQLVPEAIGTFGYLDEEYLCTRRVSPASDVYSFGVVTLEVLTGRPHVSSSEGEVPMTLVSSVLPVIQDGKLRDVLDSRRALAPTPRQLEALQLLADTAVLCLWPKGEDRPGMSMVVANLETALINIRSDETSRPLCY